MKFGVRLVEVKLVKKAMNNGVPPNLGDSGPAVRYNDLTRPVSQQASHGKTEKKIDLKTSISNKQIICN